MVDKQLQVMPHVDLVPNVSSLGVRNDGGMLVGVTEGVARAKVKPNEAYSKVGRIILAEGLYLRIPLNHCTFKYYGVRSQAIERAW